MLVDPDDEIVVNGVLGDGSSCVEFDDMGVPELNPLLQNKIFLIGLTSSKQCTLTSIELHCLSGARNINTPQILQNTCAATVASDVDT